ncbi:DUF3667 domain-containing protein [uncultured Stenotrophomonas sp.]|uniref:DUF3667 domain-containing protein n=1 Tax=uncultured Stenotrophomonas sp. TaxID=165438 RepID=UPI0028E770A5|nr:DUF3667 domain-containing protein [uncultured Stenotrophomonas sp.]
MSSTASHLDACENCTTALQGDFCHQCGQSAHSPVRSFGHAIEEVFESFWHLDGRIFRTLRQLLLPGRLAADYLAGHRTRYIPPIRLFVIVAVLTFFVARLAVHVDAGTFVDQTPAPPEVATAFKDARTTEEVEKARLTHVKPLETARDTLPESLRFTMDRAIAKVEKQAAQRNRELSALPAATPSATPAPPPVPVPARPKAYTPVDIDFLPGFANRWLTGQAEIIRLNLPRINERPQLLVNAFFASVPSALFVLVPLFAFLLKVFYLGSGRLYLEHLVVALYSHAFLCVALLGILLLTMVAGQMANVPIAGTLIGVVVAVLLAWMPLYLLLMQRRVYGQSWLVTFLKFTALGWLYFTVVTTATVFLAIASLARI